jgi:hypothetical protein
MIALAMRQGTAVVGAEDDHGVFGKIQLVE